MTVTDLDRPAGLTVWDLNPKATRAVEPVAFATLRAALREARRALKAPDLQPWITTAGGEILTPAWIEAYRTRT